MSSSDIAENQGLDPAILPEDSARASTPDHPDPRHLRAPLTHSPAHERESERALVAIPESGPPPVSRACQGATGYFPHYNCPSRGQCDRLLILHVRRRLSHEVRGGDRR